ncbi:hypothetical protein [Amycolatopsis sp. Hca4]|nr:hypothetical protein [Amycolatopsis sp. Hca4]
MIVEEGAPPGALTVTELVRTPDAEAFSLRDAEAARPELGV